MFNGINPITIQRTCYAGLGVANTNPMGRPVWRFIDLHEPGRTAAVGPVYQRKKDLLADLHDYAQTTWGYNNDAQ